MTQKFSIKGFLSNNFGLKLVALGLAIVLWLIVYSVNDPDIEKSYTIPVTIQNADDIYSLGKTYEILDGTDNILISVRTKRSNFKDLGISDFEAVADFSQISIEGDEAIVPITVSAKRHSSEIRITSAATKNMRLSLEDLATRNFTISAKATGELAEGYALGSIEVVSPTMITVEGPSSLIGCIENAVATIDLKENMFNDFSASVRPIYLDADGNKVDMDRMNYVSSDKVVVSVTILASKTVPIKAAGTTGTPAEGYAVSEVKFEPKEVTIKGNREQLGGITSVEIPASALNVAGANGNISSNLDITAYLPAGVNLAQTSDASVATTIVVESSTTKSYTIDTSNLTIKGLDKTNKATISQAAITVKVTGMEDDLANITAESIIGIVDVTGLELGSHSVTVEFKLDEKLYKCSTVNVTVSISESSDATDSGNGNSTGDQGTGDSNSGNASGTSTRSAE